MYVMFDFDQFLSVMLDIWLKLFAAANHKNKILQKTL